MPKPRKSLAELAASGTLNKNSGRYQARLAAIATVILPVGRPPAHFTVIEKNTWTEVIKLAPAALLQRSDRLAIELAIKLLVRVRTTDAKVSELNALSTVLGKLGLNPADRLRMDVERAPQPAELAAQSAEDAVWASFDILT